MLNSTLKSALGLIVLVGTALPGSLGADEMTLRSLAQSNSAGIALRERMDAVSVTLDFARILTFNSPARTIIIGNPAVVDGTLSDDRTIVLTGKAVGTTNVIVLGEAGREVASFVVNVTTNSSQSITVHQGETQQTYTCAGTCRPPTAPPALGSKGASAGILPGSPD